MGIKLHRGFESRPLRQHFIDRNIGPRKRPRDGPFGPPGVFSVCFRAFLGLHGLDPGQGFLGGLLGQKDGVGLGQLDAHDLNCGPPRIVIPTRSDRDARKEGLVVAASRALVGQFVNARDVLCQLQTERRRSRDEGNTR
jgi:hypothetical protein